MASWPSGSRAWRQRRRARRAAAAGRRGARGLVDARSLSLFCTPAINLFHKRLDRIQVGSTARGSTTSCPTAPGRWTTRCTASLGHRLRHRPGRAAGVPAAVRHLPRDGAAGGGRAHGYYTVRREPPAARRGSSRTAALVLRRRGGVPVAGRPAACALTREDVRQLSVSAWVTNRDLPNLLPPSGNGGAAAWRLESPGRSRASTCCAARPGRSRGDRWASWAGAGQPPDAQPPVAGRRDARAARRGAAHDARLYAPPEDTAWARQAEGVHGVEARPVVRRLPFKGPLTFGTGVEIVLELDELAYQGQQRVPVRERAGALLRAPRGDQQLHPAHAAHAAARRGDALAAAHRPAGDGVKRDPRRPSSGGALAVAVRRAAGRSAGAHDFFAVLRRMERCGRTCRAWARRCGRRRRALRLGAGSRARLRARRARRASTRAPDAPRLGVRFFGLLGPQGPMPLHFTEYVRERLRFRGDATPARFLDVFHHRLLTLFYRAWAQAQPAVHHDRPDDDRFAAWLGASCGEGTRARRRPLPARRSLFQAGLLARAAAIPRGSPSCWQPLRRAGGDRAARAAMARAGGRRPQPARLTRAAGPSAPPPRRRARRRRRRRLQGARPPVQVPHRAGAAHAGPVPRVPSRRRGLARAVRLGAALHRAWTCAGTCAGLAAAEVPATSPGPPAAAGRHRLDRPRRPRARPRRPAPAAPRLLPLAITEAAMLEISRTALFGKLNPVAYKAIEGATVFCKLRGNPYVELQHWLYQILNSQDSDLHRIVKHYGLDASQSGPRPHRLAGPAAARRHARSPICRAGSRGGRARLGLRLADVRRHAGAHRLPGGRPAEDAVAAQCADDRSPSSSIASSWRT